MIMLGIKTIPRQANRSLLRTYNKTTHQTSSKLRTRLPFQKERMDNIITTAESTAAESKVVIQPQDPSIQPLDLEDEPKVRTKFRLWTVIIALNVNGIRLVTEYYC